MRKILPLFVSFLFCLFSVAASAAPHEHERGRGGRWHGDIRHFHERDVERWHGGRWYHGRHGGRGGWWWIVGATWYFYPAPIYPYPDPYQPPLQPATPPQSQYWYYCNNPSGYYPYVARCYGSWRRVAADPYRP